MVNVKLVEEKVSGPIRFFKEKNPRIIINLHLFYHDSVESYPVDIEGINNEIMIMGDKKILEHLKSHLIRRETWTDVLWSVIQSEYVTLDRVEEKIEKLQNASIHAYSKKLLGDILKMKKSLFHMHRDYIRLRNIVEDAIDEGYERKGMSRIYRDVNEMIDIVEYLIDGATMAIEIMQNTLSSKMNEIMKILTVIATIMMPLTLITGIYGMNFRNMPELKWEYGYYYSLLLMFAIAILMLFYFKKKRIL